MYDTFYDDFEDLGDPFATEADELAFGAALGGALGGKLGNDASGWLYDKASNYLGSSSNSYARRFGRGMKNSKYGRDLVTTLGGAAGGFAGGAAGTAIPWFEADQEEFEYEVDQIDEMEALLDIALEADGETAEDALTGLVSKAFGVMRGAGRLQQIMRTVHAKVRQIVAQARRNPQMQAAARAVPMALRRTAATILRRLAAGQPVNPEIALRIFAGVMADIIDTPSSRRAATNRSRARARRHLARG